MINQSSIILINKNISEATFYILNGEEKTAILQRDLVELLFQENQLNKLIAFETYEKENLLLSGYFVLKNKNTFMKHLNRASKAKVPW